MPTNHIIDEEYYEELKKDKFIIRIKDLFEQRLADKKYLYNIENKSNIRPNIILFSTDYEDPIQTNISLYTEYVFRNEVEITSLDNYNFNFGPLEYIFFAFDDKEDFAKFCLLNSSDFLY